MWPWRPLRRVAQQRRRAGYVGEVAQVLPAVAEAAEASGARAGAVVVEEVVVGEDGRVVELQGVWWHVLQRLWTHTVGSVSQQCAERK